jgi:hypothetical protein
MTMCAVLICCATIEKQAFTKTAESCGANVALTSSMYDHVKKVSLVATYMHGACQDTTVGLSVLLHGYVLHT